MKIVIADDHAVVRTGFSMILNYQEDMEVVATAADGVEAYQKVLEHQPDVLILDLSMPPGAVSYTHLTLPTSDLG